MRCGFGRREDFTSQPLPTESGGVSKFPAYGLRHPRKTTWLLHQHRPAYETRVSDMTPGERDLAQRVREFDHRHLNGTRLFTISRRVSDRLRLSNRLDSVALYHPPFEPEKLYCGEALPYIFFPSRFESAKRQELLVRAMAFVKSPVGALLVGEGGQIGRMRELVSELALQSRVRLLGTVGWDQMRALYARALAVFFGPEDEDYGYVTLEAMLSRKPVITCTDSGGPLEFVVDDETGCIVAPEPVAVAEAIDALWADRARARRMGEANPIAIACSTFAGTMSSSAWQSRHEDRGRSTVSGTLCGWRRGKSLVGPRHALERPYAPSGRSHQAAVTGRRPPLPSGEL